MDDLPFYLQWIGVCTILYAISHSLYHSHRFDEDEGITGRRSGIRWVLYRILWLLAFPVSIVFSHLNKEHDDLTRGIAVRDTRSEMYREIKELREQIWMPLEQKKLKTHLFHQNLWRRTEIFCDTHGMPDAVEFRIHIFAALHLLVSDILQIAKAEEEMIRQLPVFISRIYDVPYVSSLTPIEDGLISDSPANVRMKEIIGHHSLLFRLFTKSSLNPEDPACIEDILLQALTNAEIETGSDYCELHPSSEFLPEFHKLIPRIRTQGRVVYSLLAAPMPKSWTEKEDEPPSIRYYYRESQPNPNPPPIQIPRDKIN